VSKRKLLLADDSVTIQKVVDLTFQDEGFEVISVGDGNSAMDKLREDQPDLVLADVNMPGLNGYEICDKIKNSGDFGDIPVVLLVGSFEPFDSEEAERVGADTHLTKPFQSISQLVNVVYGLVGPGSVESHRVMSAAQSGDGGTFELPENPPDFGSLEADDEMIQTDQIGSVPVDEVSRFESQPQTETPEASFESTSSFETFNSVEEANFTAFERPIDNNPAIFANEEISSDDSSSGSDDDFKEFSIVEPTESYGVTTGSIDEGEMEESNSLDTEEETPESVEETEGFEGFDSHSFDGADTAEFPSPDEDLLSLDDFNLLEVPVADDESEPVPEDETSFSDSDSEEAVAKTDDETSMESEVSFDDDASSTEDMVAATETGFEVSGEDSVSFEDTAPKANSGEVEESDELVERIARRVIEMMSDKVVKEVAWEVVPQMSDLIIKEMAREKMKD